LGLQEVQTFDVGQIERDLQAKITDWRGHLSRNVAEARQVLRALMPTRLTFTAKEEGGERFYRFDGMAVLDRLLSGVVLPKAVVAPTGFVAVVGLDLAFSIRGVAIRHKRTPPPTRFCTRVGLV
jgi:hypothetical protein